MPWFVVQTQPKSELRARDHLLAQDYTVYLPLMAQDSRKQSNGTLEPLFPGYLFTSLEWGTDDPRPIKYTRGCRGLVRFGEQAPAPLPDGIVEELMAGEEAHRIARRYQVGDRVRIKTGPFRFFEAVIHEISGEKRCWLLMDALGLGRIQASLLELEPV